MSDEDVLFRKSMTTTEADRSLNKFFESFGDRATKSGVVVIESVPIPSDRGRSLVPSTVTRRIRGLTHTISSGSNGCYALSTTSNEMSFDWCKVIENSSDQENLSVPDFMKALESNGSGYQCSLCPSLSGIRQELNLSRFPIPTSSREFVKICNDTRQRELTRSHLYISTKATPATVHIAPVGLTTLIFHHRGAPKHWIVVSPEYKDSFESRVREEFKPLQAENCSSFINHVSLWISPEVLSRWGIRFNEVTQQEHQLMIVFPNAYHWGYSPGFNMVERKYYMGPSCDYSEFRFCNDGETVCQISPILRFGRSDPNSNVDCGECSKKRLNEEVQCSPAKKYHRRGLDASTATARICSQGVGTYSPAGFAVARGAVGVQSSGQGSNEGADVLMLESSDGLDKQGRGSVAIEHNNTRLGETLGQEDLSVSDEEESADLVRGVDRVAWVHQEVVGLAQDLDTVMAERDEAIRKKTMYKARVVAQEAYIETLKAKIQAAGGHSNHLDDEAGVANF